MPKIPDEVVKRVIDLARIEDVVGDFVTLRKAGVNLTGICPFHEDQHDGNFIVRPSTVPAARHGNTYRCFVCDAKGGPVQFLMNAEHMTFPDAIRYLGKKYCIEVDNVPLNWTPPPPRPIPPPPPALELPRKWVKRTIDIARYGATSGKFPFLSWFISLPWNDCQKSTMAETLWEYCVGGWKDGRVVFWMIDCGGVPRAAKLMKYQPDGHRDKSAHPGWIYNQDGCRQQLNPDEHTVLKPLFGSHLLKRYPQAAVNIVESEKTAIIMANYYGIPDRQLWLACGGLKHMTLEAMQPLIDQGRKVWLWPDKDGVTAWQEVADKLGSERVQVYTRFIDTCWIPQDGDKADCADIAIRMMGDPTFKPNVLRDKATQDADTDTEPMPNKPDGVTNEEWAEHMKIMKALGDFEVMNPAMLDGPFLDAEEMADPELHRRREIFRQRYNFNKTRNGRSKDGRGNPTDAPID